VSPAGGDLEGFGELFRVRGFVTMRACSAPPGTAGLVSLDGWPVDFEQATFNRGPGRPTSLRGHAPSRTRTAAHHTQPDDLPAVLAHIRLLLVDEWAVGAAAMNTPANAHGVFDRCGLGGNDTFDIPFGMLEPSAQDLLDIRGTVRLPDSIWRHRSEVDAGV
jgi:hypothetical protein